MRLQACVCSDCVIGQEVLCTKVPNINQYPSTLNLNLKEKAEDNWIYAKVSSRMLLLNIRFTRNITNRLLCLSEQQEVGLRQR